MVSIHATLAGGDAENEGKGRSGRSVSIHATLAGGDLVNFRLCRQTDRFLSTPPSRVATHSFAIVLFPEISFLSTPPSRVATSKFSLRSVSGHVSIHATLAGGDNGRFKRIVIDRMFLSTPPSRVATIQLFTYWQPKRVSIHATLAGGDGFQHLCRIIFDVSIHATLAGGDGGGDADCWYQCVCFYPRHPRGWRRWHIRKQHANDYVSIHATLAGGDKVRVTGIRMTSQFLSTPPSRVATGDFVYYWENGELFLSTPPSRVATCQQCRSVG